MTYNKETNHNNSNMKKSDWVNQYNKDYNDIENDCDEIKDIDKLTILGDKMFEAKNYAESIELYLKALKLCQVKNYVVNKHDTSIPNLLNSISNSYLQLKNYDESKKFVYLAKEIETTKKENYDSRKEFYKHILSLIQFKNYNKALSLIDEDLPNISDDELKNNYFCTFSKNDYFSTFSKT